MKRLLLVAAAAGAVVIAGLLLAPAAIDWDAYRTPIAAELSRVTGRTVSLDGPIEASFLPSPRILANNVRLGSSGKRDGSDDLLRLRAVEVQVSLLPLLTGHVVIERLTLVRPEILVESDETGHVSWLMDGTSGALPADVALQRFAISDGTLVWRDRQRGLQARIEDISLQMTADTLSGPAKAKGTANVGGVPVRFALGVGRAKASGPVPVSASLEEADVKATGEFVGQYLPAEERLTGRLKASGTDARAVLAQFLGSSAGDGVAAALIAHPFGLEGRISVSAEGVDADDVLLEVADQRATGAIRARLPQHPGDQPAVDVKFSIPRLDLDSLATVPALSGKSASEAKGLPHQLSIDLSVNADAVLVDGRAVQGFATKASFADGKLNIERMQGQLPGAGNFTIRGVVAEPDAPTSAGNVPQKGVRFLGTIQAEAANLRDLLSWLRVDAEGIPAGRLARAQFTAGVLADGSHTELSDIDFHVDATTARGTATVDYRQSLTLNLNLSADRLDLDAYLGGDAGTASPISATASSMPTLADLPSAPTPTALSTLGGDARFAVAHLVYRGMDLRDVDVSARIGGGKFQIDRFSGQPPEPEQALAPDRPMNAGPNPASPGPEASQPPSKTEAAAEPSPPSAPSAPEHASVPDRPTNAESGPASPGAEASEPPPKNEAAAKSLPPPPAPVAESSRDATPAPVREVEDRDDFVRGLLKNLDR